MFWNNFIHSRLALILLPLVITGVLFISSCTDQKKEETFTFAHQVPEHIDFNFHVRPILSDRCYTCHGPDEKAREAGLRFDIESEAFKELSETPGKFAIIKGDIVNSQMIQRIFSKDSTEVMPPPESNLFLEDYEKEILKKWIAQGAEWKTHWSFIPPQKAALPLVENKKWVNNEIDYFILNKLEKEKISPNPEATKEQLIRRVYFDLTGLPPTLEAIDIFLKDDDKTAYEKIVDQLLASSAFAENQAAHWLDLARYADTHGYQDDLPRLMYPWRDWVIHAFDKNLPYDQFVKWQIAGDLLPNATREQILATAFNRNHKITQEGGVIPEEYRTEYVADRSHTFATAFLGITMECARCHDHKYDPVTQKEYYSLFSFFNSVEEKGLIDYGEIPEPTITLSKKEIEEVLTFIKNVEQQDSLKIMVMADMTIPRKTYQLNRGQYDQPLEEVFPATPDCILPFSETLPANRLGLAEWLMDKNHPLFARVTVNRFWQQIFGNGIVSTPFDFGNQGALPVHPELLDWLAVHFRENNWDVKAFFKYMVMSSTYRQSSVIKPALMERDPKNELLARGSRSRLTAEQIRDQALAISDLLVADIGGPSVKPYQPPGLWDEMTAGGGRIKYVQDKGEKLYRRSLYTYWKRTVPPPSMMTFDAAGRDLCTVKRQSTSTPLQALVLLNDPQFLEASKVLAFNTIKKCTTDKDCIQLIFRKATSRFPTEKELAELINFYQEEKKHFSGEEKSIDELINLGEYKLDFTDINKVDWAALTILASTILNLDETITKT
jgi:uncharacterized protein DUF1553/uncharacterized protein DUF1549/cytochrome c